MLFNFETEKNQIKKGSAGIQTEDGFTGIRYMTAGGTQYENYVVRDQVVKVVAVGDKLSTADLLDIKSRMNGVKEGLYAELKTELAKVTCMAYDEGLVNPRLCCDSETAHFDVPAAVVKEAYTELLKPINRTDYDGGDYHA